MATLKLEQLGGMRPLDDPRTLPDQLASYCANVLVRSGALRPLTVPVEIHRFPGQSYPIAARLRFNDGSLFWYPLSHVRGQIAKAPITNDSHERYYLLDPPGTPMRFTTKARLLAGLDPLLLGLPAPSNLLTVAVTGGVSGLSETRAYVYTFVDEYGQEGPPSPPALNTGPIDATSWTLSDFATTVPDAGERPLISKRLYRSVVGTDGSVDYRHVGDIPLGTTSYTDTAKNTRIALNYALGTISYLAPPDDMEGFATMPGGFMVGWKDRTLHFSEPYKPWAWPAEYDLALDFQIIGAGVVQQTLVVGTTGNPYTLSGNTPQAMTPTKNDRYEPCISRESIVAGVEAVFYASANGLVSVNAAGAAVITDGVIGLDRWVQDYAYTIYGAARFGPYYMALNGIEDGQGFLLALDDAREAVGRLLDFRGISAIWNDAVSGDIMAMTEESSDSVVYRITPRDASSLSLVARPFSWVSKEFVLPTPVNYGAAMVLLEGSPLDVSPQDVPAFWDNSQSVSLAQPLAGLSATDRHDRMRVSSMVGMTGLGYYAPAVGISPAPGELPPGALPPGWYGWPWWPGVNRGEGRIVGTSLYLPPDVAAVLSIYANRKLIYQEAVAPNRQVRLPSGFRASVWQVSIISRVPVYSIQLATTGRELSDV